MKIHTRLKIVRNENVTMLVQLDAASVVLTAVKRTLVTGRAAFHRVLDDKHTASYTKVEKVC